MHTRKATREDAEKIAEFIAMAEGEMLVYFFKTDDPNIHRNGLLSFILSPTLNRYSLDMNIVAEENGVVAGSVTAFPADRQPELDIPLIERLKQSGVTVEKLFLEGAPGTYYLSTMGVNPDFRGRGIGTMLMEAAEEEGRNLGFEKTSLLVSKDKDRARHLYERRGYEIVDDAVAIAVGAEYYRMAKNLL